jgi:hypothetical protein
VQAALDQFHANLSRARDLLGLAQGLSAQTTTALDLSDLMRAALVLGVSAFDHFIHEIARKGILETATGIRADTETYRRFPIPLGITCSAGLRPLWLQHLDDEVRQKHSWQSFQDPNKVAEAIRLVSRKELWKEVGIILKCSAEDVKAQLKLVVDRRNKIAHEADIDPTSPGMRWPMTHQVATEALNVLEKIGSVIFMVVTTP